MIRSIYITFSKWQNYIARENINGFQGTGMRGECWKVSVSMKRQQGAVFCGNETILYLKCGNDYMILYMW